MKDIPNFPNYCATKDGRIWSKKRNIYLKPVKSSRGYFVVTPYKNGKDYWRNIHQLVLETFVGSRPVNMECRHLNNNKLDNRLSNLEWSSKEKNNEDRIKFGSTKGTNNGRCKLSEKNVREIRQLLPTMSMAKISRKFSVTDVAISHIRDGKNWSWLR